MTRLTKQAFRISVGVPARRAGNRRRGLIEKECQYGAFLQDENE